MLVSHFEVLHQRFLYYGQGAVRRATLYGDRASSKGTKFWIKASLYEELSLKGATLKVKNLLLEEQILFFKSCPHCDKNQV